MGWIKRVEDKIEQASTCPSCGHSESAGVSSCKCPRGDCACG